MIATAIKPHAHRDWSAALDAARAPTLRTYTEFAQAEIVLPNGPYAGRKLRPHMQPATFVWLAELDRGSWRRHVYLGPVQSGKTLSALVIPLMHVLFERGETAILGAPKDEIAHDKWREDFLPVIKRSRYGELLPTSGAGSRGGTPADHVHFKNGATLKFMSGQGSDDSRSAFTARYAFVTETDKMDEASEVSRESDPVKQIEDRTMAFDRLGGGFLFLECTVSFPTGKIWSEYQASSGAELALPCPHCKHYVTPERENFLGWQEAKSEDEAAARSHFSCPECGEAWTEDERIAANGRAVLLHRGQTADRRGRVRGDVPSVRTLGFRASAVNNAFVSAATVGINEWLSAQSEEGTSERDNWEKTLTQKIWALPWEPPDLADRVTASQVKKRAASEITKGIVPDNVEWFTVGVDLRKREGHWVAPAWLDDQTVHVADYDRFEVRSDQQTVELALDDALRRFADRCEEGWQLAGGGRRVPDAVWIDAGYKGKAVFTFCHSAGIRYLPIWGRGQSQQVGYSRSALYTRPKQRGGIIKEIGEEYHIEWSAKYGCHIVIINADEWKTYLHDRITTPVGRPGALTLFSDQGNDQTHRSLARHWTAEHMEWQVIPGKGERRVWITDSRANHWFDAGYISAAAAHFCGWLIRPTAEERRQQETRQAMRTAIAAQSGLTNPYGQPFVATER